MSKSCIGNYMCYPICEGHSDCKEVECFSKTSIEKGVCDCPYKGSCHLLRQEYEMQLREDGATNESCWFYNKLKPIYEQRVGLNK